MTMLAEELLLAKGVHLPVHEKAVIAAMDVLGEPPLIQKRRQARMWVVDHLMEVLRTEALDDDDRLAFEAATNHEGGAYGLEFIDNQLHVRNFNLEHDDPAALRKTKMSLAKVIDGMPEDLKPFLKRGSDDLASYESHVFLRSLLATGGLYRLDGGEDGTQGVLDSIWGGLPFTDLPKLPYPRMWFEARGPNGEPMPLWRGNPPADAWNKVDCGELWGLAISEIVQGTAWAVVAVRHSSWFYETQLELEKKDDGYVRVDHDSGMMFDSHRYERLDARTLQDTPKSPDEIWIGAPEDRRRFDSEAAYRGAMVAWAVCLADIVTARNVDRRQTFLSGRTRKQLARAAPMKKFFATVYDVSISTSTSDEKDETGNYLHVRFMVRGHWRISDAPHAEWVEAKGYTCIWIRSHLKGPVGAPWKGRPVYVEPRQKGEK